MMFRRGGLTTRRGSFVPRYEFGNSHNGLIGGRWETYRGLMDIDPQAS
jgi:hypothetical protein